MAYRSQGLLTPRKRGSGPEFSVLRLGHTRYLTVRPNGADHHAMTFKSCRRLMGWDGDVKSLSDERLHKMTELAVKIACGVIRTRLPPEDLPPVTHPLVRKPPTKKPTRIR